MTGTIASLDDARRAAEAAAQAALRAGPGQEAANRYILRAEEAMALIPHHVEREERAALFAIAETWLTLAENALTQSRA